MRIIASGLSGTIGRHVPAEVIPLNQRLEKLEANSINLTKSDRYIHFAGIVGPSVVDENPKHARKINVENVVELAEISRIKKVEKFVYVSTGHVYKRSTLPLSEGSDLEPLSTYAEQKLEAETRLIELFKDEPSGLVILRLFSILDWDVHEFTLGGAIKRILNDSEFTLGGGMDLRDFLTPKQAAGLIVELTQMNFDEQIMNVCTGKPVSVANAAINLLNSKQKGDWAKRVLNNHSATPVIIGNPSKIMKVLSRELRWSYDSDEE